MGPDGVQGTGPRRPSRANPPGAISVITVGRSRCHTIHPPSPSNDQEVSQPSEVWWVQGLCSDGKATEPVNPVIYYPEKSNPGPAALVPPSLASHAA
ncbi:hypothetical protein AAFF_G00249050 [Aldrovandia affinis]|uniref:Uncharacterized protein n=1 Tax=Aldrovandia affinis TaxID=143900 RepID=A0AAD7W2S0_9TELE|nr:hypothetical protein AAFF_G00249050 [Aldrovandia affinis]